MIQEVTLSVIFNGDTVSVDTELTVAEPVEVLTCEEPAACNYGLARRLVTTQVSKVIAMGRPQDGYAFFKKLNQNRRWLLLRFHARGNKYGSRALVPMVL